MVWLAFVGTGRMPTSLFGLRQVEQGSREHTCTCWYVMWSILLLVDTFEAVDPAQTLSIGQRVGSGIICFCYTPSAAQATSRPMVTLAKRRQNKRLFCTNFGWGHVCLPPSASRANTITTSFRTCWTKTWQHTYNAQKTIAHIETKDCAQLFLSVVGMCAMLVKLHTLP